jgi:hypothetical protein
VTYILAYLAGALSFGLLTMVVLMCIHRAPPPTLHHRRANRDRQERLGPEFERVLYDNLWDLYATDPKLVEPVRMYGVTGLEE